MKKHARVVISLGALLLLLSFAGAARGRTYHAGPGQEYPKISSVVDMLKPGDTVELTGDVVDAFVLHNSGTKDKPITLRGITRVEDGRMIRPKILFDQSNIHRIACWGNWNVFEGLDISGAIGERARGGTAIHTFCANTVFRNCRIHHSNQGIYAKYNAAGDILIEFCEFDSIGYATMGPSVYLETPNPGAVAIIQHCYFHDGAGGPLIVSSYPRNVIRYNWFENTFGAAVKLISEDIGQDTEIQPTGPMRPMHSDILGNVFNQGCSPGSRYCILQLGGAGEANPGTEGDFNIAHNLFVMTSGAAGPSVFDLVQGNVDHVRMYNNVFLQMGGPKCLVYLRDLNWDTPDTREFIKRRGSPDPIVEGSNNWVFERSAGIPDTFRNTLRGLNPKFVDLLNGDYRPRKDSPLADAGVWPLPKGQIVDLVPEYAPQRGIPADLKPKPRRKVTPPSIGPFEVPEELEKRR